MFQRWLSRQQPLWLVGTFFLIAVAMTSSHPGGLLDMTQQAFSQIGTALAKKFPDDQQEMFQAAIASAAKIAPTLVAYTWILIAIVSMAAAQNILRQRKWNLRDNFSLLNLRLPPQLIYGVATTGLFGVFAPAPYDYIGRNLSLILGFPFFFVGLAVFHAWAASIKYPGFFLVAFYVVLTFIPWMALIVAVIGVVDQWVDFRKRIALKTTV